jgi:excinuclease ABC subunit B
VEESVVQEEAGAYAVTEDLRELQSEMADAAGKLEYERAALLRDQIRELKRQMGMADDAPLPRQKVTYESGKKRGGKRK